MNSTGKTIFKNTSVLMGSQIATWILTLILMVFLPRYLGAAAVGQFQIGDAIWAIMGVLITCGTDIYLVKEIARDPNRAPDLLGTTLVIRGCFFIIGFGLVALYLYLMDYSTTTTYVVYLIGIAALVSQFATVHQSGLQGLETMEYISISDIIYKAINTGLGITVLFMGYGVYAIGIVNTIAAGAFLLLLAFFLRRSQKLRLRFNPRLIPAILRASTPYLMAALVAILYMQVDVLIISSLVDEQAVGWYSAADRLFGTSMFFSIVFITAIFPALARLQTTDQQALGRLMRRSFDLVLLISMPIGLGIMVVAQPLVVLLFGQAFAPSGLILTVLGVVLIFTYINTLMGRFLIATDRQNSWVVLMLIATLLTVPLDLVFVPWCQQHFANGALGGAFSYVVTELGMVLVGLFLLPRGLLAWSNLRTFLLVALAGMAMVGTTWWLRDMFLAIPIVVGAITYIGMVLLLRVISAEDMALFTQFAQQLLARLRRRKAEPASVGGA